MKLCECSCGEPTRLASQTSKRFGWVKGQPMRFVRGHNNRGRKGGKLGLAHLRHGHTRNSGASPTWASWRAMITRCTNPNASNWKGYGGRGIKVCDRWLNNFDNFLADIGLRPNGTTLDRVDNNGNYEPGNCRWATRSEQQKNKRPYKHRKPRFGEKFGGRFGGM